MSAAAAPALLSIHDVMPETIDSVAALLDRIAAADLAAPALLVVPGRRWSAQQVERLDHWQRAGCELVAHGWHHETHPRGLRHRLHAALLSRNVAEHLALDREGVTALMQRAHEWFAAAALPPPRTYVPPAWALGVPISAVDGLPYRCVETLRGVYLRDGDGDGDGDGAWRWYPLPLIGFEADTALRAAFLRAFNHLQQQLARRRGRPLRIGIHPHDARLRLAPALERCLAAPWRCLRYAELSPASAGVRSRQGAPKS